MSSQQNRKTRLGDLLVDRGLITQDQLLEAIQEQKSSRLQLGEILVSKGWVSNRQIRKVLRVQSKLRNAILTSILSFSPLVLVGCGGSSSQVNGDQAVAEQQALAGNQDKGTNSLSADGDSTIHLSWDYPAERVDGSELEVYEIESFRVYQLDDQGAVGAMHVVDGLETELDISGLSDGEYHFAVTVVDTNGMESDYSEVVKVSVL